MLLSIKAVPGSVSTARALPTPKQVHVKWILVVVNMDMILLMRAAGFLAVRDLGEADSLI